MDYRTVTLQNCFRFSHTVSKKVWRVLLPFVSQHASHLYSNTPPICIARRLGKYRWLGSPACSPKLERKRSYILNLKGSKHPLSDLSPTPPQSLAQRAHNPSFASCKNLQVSCSVRISIKYWRTPHWTPIFWGFFFAQKGGETRF